MLSKAGLDVTVIEARDRIGGRTYTTNFPTPSGDIPIDLGGSWIHGTNNPEVTARGLYKGRTHETERMMAFHPRDHMPLDMERLSILYGAAYSVYGPRVVRIRKIKAEGGKGPEGDGKDMDVPYRQIWDDAYESLVALSGAKDERERDMLKLLPEVMANAVAADMEVLSGSAQDWNATYRSETPDWYLVDGYGQVYQGLVEQGGLEIGKSILLNEPVTKIENLGTKGVKVTTVNATYEADAAICTFPLGVLQKHHTDLFTPALPASKVSALSKFKMGTLDKVYMLFDDAFWPQNTDFFASFLIQEGDLLSPDPVPANVELDPSKLHAIVFLNLQAMFPDRKVPVLVCFHYRKTAALFEAAGKDRVVAFLQKHLKSLLKLPSEPKCLHSTTGWWDSDPYSYGSYSHVPVGVGSPIDLDNLRTELGAPIDRLFFAGEHTSHEAWASIHGAFNTGCREAGKVVKELGVEVDEGWWKEAGVMGGSAHKL